MLTATAVQPQAPETVYVTHPDVAKYPKARTYGFTAIVSHSKTAVRKTADIVVITPSLTSVQRAVAAVLGNEWIVSFPESTGMPF